MLRWCVPEEGTMSGTSDRTVTGPEKFVFDQRIDTLNVRIVNGAVNVVGTDGGPARLEVTEITGPPLKVQLHGSTLTVTYDDLPWKGFLKWLDRKGWERRAVVSLAVPQATRVEVGVVGAGAVISGIGGQTGVQGVNGDTTLVGLTGPVSANTVAGNVEAQSVSGDLRVNTVSGDLTVVEGSGSQVRADSVSGNMVLDLDPSAGADIRLTTVSGEIAIRIPEPGDAEVDANTTSGNVSCAFDELRVDGRWGAKRITGRIGGGGARLRASTVSGAIALLRRPPLDDTSPDGPAPDRTAPDDAAPDTAEPSLRKDR
jgi:Putative adhesin